MCPKPSVGALAVGLQLSIRGTEAFYQFLSPVHITFIGRFVMIVNGTKEPSGEVRHSLAAGHLAQDTKRRSLVCLLAERIVLSLYQNI
jgi:hypothetical protein